MADAGAQDTVDFNLALRLKAGRNDIFLPVTGTYRRSCLGNTIDYLLKVRVLSRGAVE